MIEICMLVNSNYFSAELFFDVISSTVCINITYKAHAGNSVEIQNIQCLCIDIMPAEQLNIFDPSCEI